MKQLMGGQDVNDYYPGGRKNPLDPIMYKAFLDMVNSKQKGPKRKAKKKSEKKKETAVPAVEPLRTEPSINVGLKWSFVVQKEYLDMEEDLAVQELK